MKNVFKGVAALAAIFALASCHTPTEEEYNAAVTKKAKSLGYELVGDQGSLSGLGQRTGDVTMIRIGDTSKIPQQYTAKFEMYQNASRSRLTDLRQVDRAPQISVTP